LGKQVVKGYGEPEVDAMEYQCSHVVTLSSIKNCVCDLDHSLVLCKS
jgi:hypothetical protein